MCVILTLQPFHRLPTKFYHKLYISLKYHNLTFRPIHLNPFPERPWRMMPFHDLFLLMCSMFYGLVLKELARDRLMSELAGDRASALDGGRDSRAKASLSAATVGASVGAGLGLVLAVVMGAASALRKP